MLLSLVITPETQAQIRYTPVSLDLTNMCYRYSTNSTPTNPATRLSENRAMTFFVTDSDYLGIQVGYTATNSVAVAMTNCVDFCFHRSVDGTTYETDPFATVRVAVDVPATTTNTYVAVTNLTTYAIGYIRLTLRNPTTNSVKVPTVTGSIKPSANWR